MSRDVTQGTEDTAEQGTDSVGDGRVGRAGSDTTLDGQSRLRGLLPKTDEPDWSSRSETVSQLEQPGGEALR